MVAAMKFFLWSPGLRKFFWKICKILRSLRRNFWCLIIASTKLMQYVNAMPFFVWKFLIETWIFVTVIFCVWVSHSQNILSLLLILPVSTYLFLQSLLAMTELIKPISYSMEVDLLWGFSDFFRGVEKGSIGNEWVKWHIMLLSRFSYIYTKTTC